MRKRSPLWDNTLGSFTEAGANREQGRLLAAREVPGRTRPRGLLWRFIVGVYGTASDWALGFDERMMANNGPLGMLYAILFLVALGTGWLIVLAIFVAILSGLSCVPFGC